MNITFLIGNGFDLDIGLKTRYIDVYNSYIDTPSKNDYIESFKNSIRADKHSQYKTWSDFEMAMAQFASCFNTEDEYVKCIRDFKSHMVTHLKNEETKFFDRVSRNEKVRIALLEKFENNFLKFYRRLTPNEIEELCVNQVDHYSIISFNYTRIFDSILSTTDKYSNFASKGISYDPVIHIHGNVDNDVVMGVDNISQFQNLRFTPTTVIKRAFVKPYFNNYYDKNRISKAIQAIKKSSIVCVFGFSFGESDKSWLVEIKQWLLSDPSHHLIYNYYDSTEYDSCNQDLLLDLADERKEKIIQKFECSEQEYTEIIERIHIPVGENIFNLGILEYEAGADVYPVY